MSGLGTRLILGLDQATWLNFVQCHEKINTFRKSKNGSKHKFKASACDSWNTRGCSNSKIARAFTNNSLCCLFLNSLGVRWARPLSNQPSWGSCRSIRAGWRMATLRQRRAALVILLWWVWEGPESAIAVKRWCSSVSSYKQGGKRRNDKLKSRKMLASSPDPFPAFQWYTLKSFSCVYIWKAVRRAWGWGQEMAAHSRDYCSRQLLHLLKNLGKYDIKTTKLHVCTYSWYYAHVCISIYQRTCMCGQLHAK